MPQVSSDTTGSTLPPKPSYQELFISFLPTYLLVLLFLLAGIVAIDYTLTQSHRNTLAARQTTKIHLTEKMIHRTFDNVASDVVFLSKATALKNYLEDSQEKSLRQLEILFNNLANSRKIYDQVRLLDNNGQEVVRVNYQKTGAETVPTDQLQNKANRYYFNDTIKLPAGKMYISPLDLNIEHGQIQQPLKPTIRFAMPVFDATGNKRGIVIFNYLGQILLSQISEFAGNDRKHQATDHAELGHATLLNKDGHWLLSGSDEHRPWGFMFNITRGFDYYNPTVWQLISSQESGQIEIDKGLYTFSSVTPLSPEQTSSEGATEPYAPSKQLLFNTDFSWYLVSHINSEQLRTLENFHNQLMGKSALIGAILLSPLCWVLTKVRLQNRNSQKLVQLNEQKFRTLADYSHSWESWVGIDGEIIYISPSCERICGYTPEELMNQPDLQHEIVHEEDKSELTNHLLVDASNKETCQLNFRIRARNGETKWIAHTCRPVYSESGELLGRRVSNRDATRLVAVEQRLKKQALHDNLTGLPNRTLLLDRLEVILTSHARKNLRCAVMFVDLDNFKCINDEFGHDAGDEILCEVSKRLSLQVRASDTVARLGGDEFIVLVVDLDSVKEINHIAQKIIASIQKPMPYENPKTPLTTSIGISLFPDHDTSPQGLIKKADQAMYIAKQKGKNCHSTYWDS